VIRYHELGLKGGNRAYFEKRLVENLRHALRGTPELRISRIRGRILVRAGVPVGRLAATAARVFGISSLSPAAECAPLLEDIAATAERVVERALSTHFLGRGEVPFRVSTNRALKSFPGTSQRIDAELGGRLLARFPVLRVDLHHPALELEVDLREEGTWVFAERLPGPGGLPCGVMGRGLCLLSGGIDSPVAAWLSMKRGLRVDFVSFYSFPHVGPQTREKILRQAKLLARWQPRCELHIVPFTAFQEAIRDSCPAPYRTVLYRRAMQRIASRIGSRRKAKALITGESVGQVASQTLENLALIEEASRLPVLRPLVTYDKQETIALARRIGSYEISVLPAPDCCTVFQPSHPVIHGRLDEALAAETALDLDTLVRDAVRGAERLHFPETE